MNYATTIPMSRYILSRKVEIYSILDSICEMLELTPSQHEAVRTSYTEVAKWVAASSNPLLNDANIYAQGSMALGTTVRPIGREDFDVDLICKLEHFSASEPPSELKRIVGQRLKENARYAAILEEKKRCWRLNYKRNFHLDISPSIRNVRCSNGGELVPDRQQKEFKPTNPKGYKDLFEKRAKIDLKIRALHEFAADARADIEPFPIHNKSKGVLRRTVQLLKRHRDIHFQHVIEDVAPISIIITTLAAQSYAYCATNFFFNSELDALIATVRLMPHFITKTVVNGREFYVIENETTKGENFAEKWNVNPALSVAFYGWHAKVLADLEKLPDHEGVDVLAKGLARCLGEDIVGMALDVRSTAISRARADNRLYVAPIVGLTTAAIASATPVKVNTFFGD